VVVNARAQTPDAPGIAARMAAAKLLGAVVDRNTPLDGLTDAEHGNPAYMALEPRDRALVRAILATALRFRRTIDALVAARLDRPVPPNALSLGHILHVAAAQMLFLDVPDSAAVDLAVEHAKADPRTVRFAGLVNAVLREIGRRKERALPAALAASVDAPDWFAEMLRQAYGPDKAAAILATHRSEAPTDFTVKTDPVRWAEAVGGFVLPGGTVRVPALRQAVTDLPGYADGAWWVQDFSAALPARLLGDVAGKRVLDLCAAPGGKTAQLALAGGKVTAVEKSRSRLKRLRGNLDRLGLTAETVEADLFDYVPAEPFDAVLLDAPCSSTGTVRRHPDVPWTKSLADIAKLAALQARMLDRAATMVAPGGILVFSNCSLDPSEGEAVADAFLAGHPGFVAEPAEAGALGIPAEMVDAAGRLRTTPADLPDSDPARAGCDGFFAARFRRLP
jgi:16S rRNA (cytosine967-C5)-methyltransferase